MRQEIDRVIIEKCAPKRAQYREDKKEKSETIEEKHADSHFLRRSIRKDKVWILRNCYHENERLSEKLLSKRYYTETVF